MGIFAWIVFGALAGWAANLVIGGPERRRQGCVVSVLVGVAGAALGGLIYRLAPASRRPSSSTSPASEWPCWARSCYSESCGSS